MPRDAERTVVVTAEPVALCWSGGKDSALALGELLRGSIGSRRRARDQRDSRLRPREHRWVRRVLLHAQARAIGIPLVEAELEPRCSNADHDAAVQKAFDEIRARWRT